MNQKLKRILHFLTQKKLKKYLLWLIPVGLLAGIGILCFSFFSGKMSYRERYLKYLNLQNKYKYFAMLDMDRDGIPELLAAEEADFQEENCYTAVEASVFIIKNNQICQAGAVKGITSIGYSVKDGKIREEDQLQDGETLKYYLTGISYDKNYLVSECCYYQKNTEWYSMSDNEPVSDEDESSLDQYMDNWNDRTVIIFYPINTLVAEAAASQTAESVVSQTAESAASQTAEAAASQVAEAAASQTAESVGNQSAESVANQTVEAADNRAEGTEEAGTVEKTAACEYTLASGLQEAVDAMGGEEECVFYSYLDMDGDQCPEVLVNRKEYYSDVPGTNLAIEVYCWRENKLVQAGIVQSGDCPLGYNRQTGGIIALNAENSFFSSDFSSDTCWILKEGCICKENCSENVLEWNRFAGNISWTPTAASSPLNKPRNPSLLYRVLYLFSRVKTSDGTEGILIKVMLEQWFEQFRKETYLQSQKVASRLEPLRRLFGPEYPQLLLEIQIVFLLLALLAGYFLVLLIRWILIGRTYLKNAHYYDQIGLTDHTIWVGLRRTVNGDSRKLGKFLFYLLITERLYTILEEKYGNIEVSRITRITETGSFLFPLIVVMAIYYCVSCCTYIFASRTMVYKRNRLIDSLIKGPSLLILAGCVLIFQLKEGTGKFTPLMICLAFVMAYLIEETLLMIVSGVCLYMDEKREKHEP